MGVEDTAKRDILYYASVEISLLFFVLTAITFIFMREP